MHFACLGVGVGPSNLSLASLLYNRPSIKNVFFDKKVEFSWHDGLQLPGTYLQVSLFKDLVLLADPTNKFSFISYLHEKGRIYQFLNAQFDRVSRKEFSDYMKWVSKSNPNVVFDEEVLSIEIENHFIVETSKRKVTADNISIGVGIKPYLPEIAQNKVSQSQFHVSEFAWRGNEVAKKQIVIVGGGQSGAEVFLDLISRSGEALPASVKWISRRPNFLPLDDTPFVNDYFMPCFSDLFYSLSNGSRQDFVAKNILASDGISEPTLREIYQKIYVQQFVEGRSDLISLLPNRTVTQVTGGEGNWQVLAQHNEFGSDELLDADIVIWATGYRTADMNFLKPIECRLQREGGEYRVNADFSVQWDGPSDRRIFLQNASPKQRGLAERNLSLLAWRSQRILERITGTRTEPQLPSFVEWSPVPEPKEQKLA